MGRIITVVALAIALLGCQPSPQAIGEQVHKLLQEKIDSDPTLKTYKLVVSNVEVIHDQGNRYGGIAIVTMDGEDHSVGLKILADGDKVMYEADPGAFLFVATRALKDATGESPRSSAQEPGLRAGWSREQVEATAASCVDGIMDSARRSYEARARADGTPNNFPESTVRDGVGPMCSCMVRKIAEAHDLQEFTSKESAFFAPLVDEAMAGGQCKATGELGEWMDSAPKKQ